MMGRGGRELRKWLVACQDLNPGTSSLSGFCPGPCFPWIALATWETTHRWRPLRTAQSRWIVDQTWTGPGWLSSRCTWVRGCPALGRGQNRPTRGVRQGRSLYRWAL